MDDKERHICLIQILENNHVALINDFDQFVDVIRNCNHKGGRGTVYCKLCLQGISPDKYEKHFKNCFSLDGLQNIEMPDVDETY